MYNKLVERWIELGYITEQEKDWYIYGITTLCSGIVNILYIILLGALLKNVMLAIVFLLAFVPLREIAGGFHCKTWLSCKVGTGLVFLLCFFLANALCEKSVVFYALSAVNLVLGNCVVFMFCPVDNKKKPIEKPQYDKYKKQSLILYNVLLLLNIGYYQFFSLYATTILIALTETAVLAVVGEIEKRGGDSYEEVGKADC